MRLPVLLVLAWLLAFATGARGQGPPDPARLLGEAESAAGAFRWDAAQATLEEAARHVSRVRQSDLAVRIFLLLGDVFEAQGKLAPALASRDDALTAAQAGGRVDIVAAALNETGRTALALGDCKRARRDLDEAEDDFRAASDPEGEADALTNLGNLYFSLGVYSTAQQDYHDAEAALSRAGARDVGLRCALYVDRGNVALRQGHTAEALALYGQGRALAASIVDPFLGGRIRLSLGGLLLQQGRYDDALALYRQAETSFRSRGFGLGEMQATLQIALLYLRLGGYERALGLMHEMEKHLAVSGIRLASDWRGPLALNEAAAYRMAGQPQPARRVLEQVLADRTVTLPVTVVEAAQLQLGALASDAGDLAAAREHFEAAQALLQDGANVTDRTWLALGLGEMLRRQKKLVEARRQFEQARQLATFARNPLPDLAWRAALGLGRVDRAAGDRTRALAYYLEAVGIIESVRGTLSSDELKDTFASDKHPVYEELIDLLEESGRSQEAFAISERARARALLDILRRGQVDPSRGEVTPLDLADVQAALPADVTLLSYFVTSDKTFLWIVSRTGFVAQTLPLGRDVVLGILGDSKHLGCLRRQAESRMDLLALETFPTQDLERLYETLAAPAEPYLHPGTRVGILPDGPLYYLPFGLLVAGRRSGISPGVLAKARGSGDVSWLQDRFWMESHPLFYGQSASVLVQQAGHRGQPTDVDRLLIYAAPALGVDIQGRAPEPTLLRVRHSHFSPLPGAEAEGRALCALAKEYRLRDGLQCLESAFFRDLAGGGFDILHVATHGFLDDRDPMLSGLVMTPEAPPYIGYVLARDLYGAHVSARLAVMSACRTGLGTLAGGEGIVGLTRAFEVAGMRQVMATLWSISDEATPTLMVRFYQSLQRRPDSVARALQAAQAGMIADALADPSARNLRFAHPYLWGPFVAFGADW